MKKNKIVILDNGHGSNTPGKCSPDKSLMEWQWNRIFVDKLRRKLISLGYTVFLVVPENSDIGLLTRVNRINNICDKFGKDNCIMISIHVNAAGMGNWMNATGWSAWTTKGNTNSDKLAQCLCDMCKAEGIKLRTNKSDGDDDYESNFTIIYGAKCPAVLTENLFMDNKQDLQLLKSEETIQKLLNIHVNGINEYFSKYTSK